MCMSQGSPVTAGSDIEGCGTGVQAGWVYRVGIQGWVPGVYYPATLLEEVLPSEAGPGSPARAGVGGVGPDVRGTAAGTVRTTLRARSVPCRPLPVLPSQNAALQPYGRELTSFS